MMIQAKHLLTQGRWCPQSLVCLTFDIFLQVAINYTCISIRIVFALILLIKMLLTAFYFILYTFTNGEEGKVSSKKTLNFVINICDYGYQRCLHSILLEILLMEMEASCRLVAHLK